jgi:tetratricopeptide (TPR) repeat protein
MVFFVRVWVGQQVKFSSPQQLFALYKNKNHKINRIIIFQVTLRVRLRAEMESADFFKQDAEIETPLKKKGLEELVQDVERKPKDSFALYELGYYHYRQAELDVSSEYFKKAIALNPSIAMLHAVELNLKATRISKAIKDGE